MKQQQMGYVSVFFSSFLLLVCEEIISKMMDYMKMKKIKEKVITSSFHTFCRNKKVWHYICGVLLCSGIYCLHVGLLSVFNSSSLNKKEIIISSASEMKSNVFQYKTEEVRKKGWNKSGIWVSHIPENLINDRSGSFLPTRTFFSSFNSSSKSLHIILQTNCSKYQYQRRKRSPEKVNNNKYSLECAQLPCWNKSLILNHNIQNLGCEQS